MASLHLKSFEVQVFLPGWEHRSEMDMSASIQSFTEITAVLRVMERWCVTEAEAVSVALLDGEKWCLYEVRIPGGGGRQLVGWMCAACREFFGLRSV